MECDAPFRVRLYGLYMQRPGESGHASIVYATKQKLARRDTTNTMFGVFLLLRTKDGRKRPTRTKVPVLKGELVEELDEAIPADRYSGEHNYRVYNYEPAITFYCDATDVASLVDPEHLYLMAVPHKLRLREFYNNTKKEYVFALKTGDNILFAIHSKIVRGMHDTISWYCRKKERSVPWCGD